MALLSLLHFPCERALGDTGERGKRRSMQGSAPSAGFSGAGDPPGHAVSRDGCTHTEVGDTG